MSADVRRLVSRAWEKRRSRLFGIVFALFGTLVLSRIAETVVLRRDEANFPEVVSRRSTEYLTTAANEFGRTTADHAPHCHRSRTVPRGPELSLPSRHQQGDSL